MILEILDIVDGWVMSIDPVFLAKASAIATASFLIVALLLILILGEKRRVRIDPMQQPFGDIPGWSADELRKYARMPIPPFGDDQRRSFNRASRGVALRVQDAGTVSPIPSGGAGTSSITRRPLPLVVHSIEDLGPAPEARRG